MLRSLVRTRPGRTGLEEGLHGLVLVARLRVLLAGEVVGALPLAALGDAPQHRLLLLRRQRAVLACGGVGGVVEVVWSDEDATEGLSPQMKVGLSP